jgi:hypothetical protein
MNSRAANGESSANACEDLTFHGHTLWGMCRYTRFQISLTTGPRSRRLAVIRATRTCVEGPA